MLSREHVVLLFNQIIEYTTSADGSHRREEEMVVTTKRTDGCYKTGRKMYQVNLDVSPVPPTDIITSNICKVQYYVKVGFNFVMQ